MNDSLKDILFCLRREYGATIRKTPDGGFLIYIGRKGLLDIAKWYITKKCGCKCTQYDETDTIFVEKEVKSNG